MPRLPEITDRNQLPEQDREAFDYVTQSRGGVHLPYSVFLNHPELARRKLHVGSFVRFDTSLPANVAELVICTAAREFDCRFEWAAHAPAALRHGVSQGALDAIANRAGLDALGEDEALPVRFTRQLLQQHRVDDETYAAALERFGERGVIELAATAGYYVMSACWMNLLQIEPPADRPQLPGTRA
jgi:4-carboxymuconolactone decarboxylase